MIRILLIKAMVLLVSLSYSQVPQKKYTVLLKEIVTKRNEFSASYSKATTNRKEVLIIASRDYLINTLTEEVFPSWYGTPWDYNGITRKPKEGVIACGYFVTNVLTDLGFRIPRVRWAQSASEVFIKRLSVKKDIRRFTNTFINEVEDYLKSSGSGVYLVGLDQHVGFIIVYKDNIRFVHSSYYTPEIGVVSEDIYTANPLRDSNYRVIGKLFSDTMVENWVKGIKY